MSSSTLTDNGLAFAVVLCTVLIASSHILSRHLAITDGYQRYQLSVMGPWAKRTRLRWRWSQLRFETFVTTPEILLTAFQVSRNHQRFAVDSNDDKIECISGSPVSRRNTMAPAAYTGNKSGKLVCWLPFLDSLHRNERELQGYRCYNEQSCYDKSTNEQQLVGPAIQFHEISWDFMSPDIARPFAITNICDIAVMIRRLGMSWKAFRPEDGVITAEGNGHIISSTLSRSIGIILQYMHTYPKPGYSNGKELSKAEMYIPTREADMMGFGILPGCSDLKVPSFKIGTREEVFSTMDILDRSRKSSTKLKDIRILLLGKWDAHCTYGFSDIIPLAAPMLRMKHSTIIQVPFPTEYCTGLLRRQEGFVIFRDRLEEHFSSMKETSQQIKWILQQYDILNARYPEWENDLKASDQINDCNIDFLDDVHACWDTTTAYFVRIEGTHQLHYYDLMATHISHAINYWADSWSHIRSGNVHDSYGMDGLMTEGMHIYFDYLPSIVAKMRRRGFEGDEELVREAWFVMMFRGFCWWRCHFMRSGEAAVEGMILPSRYWGCRLPVYIG
ncbi:hypothetical protein MMC12_001624 [Toensbergia leucococca]|nr:hypothetical protein [Toensbergia leucococca]